MFLHFSYFFNNILRETYKQMIQTGRRINNKIENVKFIFKTYTLKAF